jgi:glycosyltransferase involved in cell wall biosynthesis
VPILSIVIPVRSGANAYLTLRHLGAQTFQCFEICISQDEWGNANKARNAGVPLTSPSTEYLLFSDDDIVWKRDALMLMMATLRNAPKASYCYGTYEMGGRRYCDQVFDARILERRNFISTMSIIRRVDFPGWDEDLERLQDYGLWLRMWAESSKYGVHCGYVIFETAVRDGITRNGRVTYEQAFSIIQKKYLRRSVAS